MFLFQHPLSLHTPLKLKDFQNLSIYTLLGYVEKSLGYVSLLEFLEFMSGSLMGIPNVGILKCH